MLQTLGQLADILADGQTVDAAVILVFGGGVALAAGVEGVGDVAGDGGTTGCVGDVGQDVHVAGTGGGGSDGGVGSSSGGGRERHGEGVEW